MSDPLITLDAAVNIAKKSGFVNMNKRWFERRIETGAMDAKEGAVTYVSESDIVGLVNSMLLHAATQNKSPT